MSVRLYHTTDMEATVRSLAQRHRNLMILMDYKSVRPIRLATRLKLGDLAMEMVMAWKPGAPQAVERWQREGGILQYRSNPMMLLPPCPPADAIMLVECPMQWDRFEHARLHARQELAVFLPPTWSLHEKTIDHLYPRRDVYATLEAYLDALQFAEQSEYLQRVARLGKWDKCVAFTSDDLMQMVGWDDKFLKFVLRRYRFKVQRWQVYTAHFPPDDHELVWAWELLRRQPQVDHKKYALLVGNTTPRTPGFLPALKRLIWRKHVAVNDHVYVADVNRKRSDIDAFDAVNNMHRGKWFKVRNFVEQLPEYPYE